MYVCIVCIVWMEGVMSVMNEFSIERDTGLPLNKHTCVTSPQTVIEKIYDTWEVPGRMTPYDAQKTLFAIAIMHDSSNEIVDHNTYVTLDKDQT